MKIYTKVVMDWDGNVLEEDSFDYDGPVAQCLGGGDQKVEQSNKPWEPVRPLLARYRNTPEGVIPAFEQASNLYMDGGPDAWRNPTFAPRDPMEQQGLDFLAQQIPSLQGLGGNTLSAVNNMLSAPDVANNPYVNGMADMITGRLNRNLSENLMPATAQGAMAAGQLGGGRQGVMQGQAIQGTQQALGDSLAQLYSNAYDKGLTAQGQGISLSGMAQNQLLAPGQLMSTIGGQDRAEAQAALNDEMNLFNFDQNREEMALDTFLQRLGYSQPYASGSTTSPGTDPMSSALGLGALGLGAFNSGLLGGGAAAAGAGLTSAGASLLPAAGLSFGTAGGAGLAGAAPLMSLFGLSDRRLKKDIKSLGKVGRHQWYSFKYKDTDLPAVGVMADEVEKIQPEAVVTLDSGYKGVLYGALR